MKGTDNMEKDAIKDVNEKEYDYSVAEIMEELIRDDTWEQDEMKRRVAVGMLTHELGSM